MHDRVALISLKMLFIFFAMHKVKNSFEELRVLVDITVSPIELVLGKDKSGSTSGESEKANQAKVH